MRRLFCLILMGLLTAQNLPTGRSQPPQVTKPFNITYDDLPYTGINKFLRNTGSILVEFTIDENGEVIDPEIIDTFNITLNDAIIDRVMRIEFEPAKQNGKPIKVKYKLPILFK